MCADIESRLEELESRLAFQEDLIESLTEVTVRQDKDIARLIVQIKKLSSGLADVSETIGSGPPPDHEIPPHY